MKKHLKMLFLMSLLLNCAYAQNKTKNLKNTKSPELPKTNTPLDLSIFKNLKARNIGPGTMSGRVTAVDAVQENPDIIYAGTASGGVWKTVNGGMTWTSIFDENPILNIGAVAIQQSNPNVVWVGTGEGNPRNTVNLGAGIYKSLDAGKTWKCMGLEKTSNIHRVLIDPTNPNIVYAGAIGNPFAKHQERGVYKSINGGETWERVLFTNESSGTGDLVMDPTNPNKLIANMWEHIRTPYDFKSGGKGSGMFISLDGGKNWKKIGEKEGLPKGDLGRMGIAIAASDPNVIYALVESSKNALYKSEDGGATWKKINEDEEVANNRPFYFFDIAVDPSNENRIYNVYQMISMSEDGGKSFKIIIPYSGVHPDHHAFWINPKDPSLIINGNDGGVAISRDRGRKWTFAESIPVGQFYHVKADNEIPYNVYGGLQDNGSWKGPAYTWMTGGIRNQYWEVVLFGDGFDVSPDPDNSRFGYAMSQGGSLARYDVLTGDAQYMKPTHPDKNVKLRYNWNAAFAQSPNDNNTIYYGSQFVHKSTDKGQNWTIISPDLTTDNKDHQKASANSGGLTIDITSAENHNTILTIAPSSLNKEVIWVGTDDGNVQLTKDGGKSWTNFNMPGLPKDSWIAQIRTSKINANEVFVVANNYRNGGAFIPYVYKSSDLGTTWQRIADESKVKGYALTIMQDPVVPNLLYLGTEQGLWISFDYGANFTQWKHGIPNVSTMDISIQERESDLLIATFGRGIFVLDDLIPLREYAKKEFKNSKIIAFKPPVAYLSNIKDAPGIMFGGDELYEAENRKYGALLKVYTDKSNTDSTKKGKADTLLVKIYDASNTLKRTLHHIVDSTGIQIINWNLDEKGNRRPGSKKPKKDSPEFGGLSVIPGNYKIVYEFKKSKDSTSIEIKADPRIAFDGNSETEKRKLLSETQKSIDKLTLAVDRLDETKEIADKIMIQTKDSEDSTLIKLGTMSKTILDSIKITRELILGKKFDKQGYGRPYVLNALSKFNELNSYLRSKPSINESDNIIAKDVKDLSIKELEKVNIFFEKIWKPYKSLIEKSTVYQLKDYEPLR